MPPPPGDRPTEFIPRIETTTYLPRIEDHRGFPAQDPDGFQAHRGSIADLDPAGPTQAIPRGMGAGMTEMIGPPITDPTTEIRGLDTGDIDGRLATDRTDRPPVRQRDTGRTVLRTLGEVLITLGMVVLLFVVYELYITNIFAAQKQANATSVLDKEWDTVPGQSGQQRVNHYDLTDGHGIAKLYIPALGHDFHFTVIEGTTQADLAIGPGHYPGTALPGQPGNMAIAGHRVGEGAPFDDLGLVRSCDAIVIETQTDWYVYRTLPMADEVADWNSTRAKSTLCAGPDGEGKVVPLTGLYAQTVGQEIVLPTEGDVVAPVPHHPNAQVSAGQEVSLLTLTTCNPKFSAAQRMIIHAVLAKDWKKNPAHPDQAPPELEETS